jgi:hypothetical protein
MDTMSAFAMGQANRGKEPKVFDWNKAARLIKETKAKKASAGLAEDWEYTGGIIFENGKIDLEDYTFLQSTWATPVIKIDGEEFDCYLMHSEATD